MPVPRFAPRQSITKQAHHTYHQQAAEDRDDSRESGYPANRLPAGPMTQSNILTMQRTVGNQAVLRLLADKKPKAPVRPGTIQRKMVLTGATRTNFYLLVAGTERGPFGTTFKQLNDYLKSYQGAKTPADEAKYLNKMRPLTQDWLKKHPAPKAGSRDAKKHGVLQELEDLIGKELVRLGKDQNFQEIGLPPSFVNELKPAEITALLEAIQAAKEGRIDRTDLHLADLRKTRGDAVNLIRSNIVRTYISKIDPALAKSMTNDKYKVSSKKSGQAAKYVQQVANQFVDFAEKDAKGFEDQYGGKMLAETELLSDQGGMKRLGYNEAPLRNLEAAGATLQSGKAIQTGKPPSEEAKASMKSLSKNEMTALVGYTSNLYSAFSNPLRNETGKQTFTGDNLALSQTAVSAMNKFKSYTGWVFRHDKIYPGFEELNRVGGVTTDLGFMSTAKDQYGASNGGTDHEVLLVLKSKSGKEIAVASIFGGEGEVLFKPGTRFRVTKSAKKDKKNGWAGADPEIQTYVNADGKTDELKMAVIKEEV